MELARTAYDENRPSPPLWRYPGDQEHRLIRAVLGGDGAIAITGPAGAGKTRLLDRVIPILIRSRVRVIRVGSSKLPLDLRRLLQQVSTAGPNGIEYGTGERTAGARQLPSDESRRVLFIDSAHTLTDEALGYLDLVASMGSVGLSTLQLVLVGRPEMWEALSRQSVLAKKIATRLVLSSRSGPARANATGDALLRAPACAPGPFDDLFEPGPSRLLPDVPAMRCDPAIGPAGWPNGPSLTGSAALPPDPPGSLPGRTGRLAVLGLATGLVVAVGAAAVWTGYPTLPWMQHRANPAAVLRPPSGMGGVARPPDTLVADEPGSTPAVQQVAAASPPMAPAPLPGPDPAFPEPGRSSLAATAEMAAPLADMEPTPTPAASPGLPAGPGADAAADSVPTVSPASTVPQASPAASPRADVLGGAATVPEALVDAGLAVPIGSAPRSAEPVAADPSRGISDMLVGRGTALLETGDVAAARLMLQRAATNSGRAALLVGMTYDPRFLAEIGAHGITPDPEAAAAWYRRASSLGAARSAALLTGLGFKE